ncbi:MAG: hypothetical protein H0V73_03020 [Chloroflexi bacterium]|nr:hypothetical protein [Chloroflexota bacterium]
MATIAALIVLAATFLAGCDLMVPTATPRPSRFVATPEPPEATPVEIDEVPTLRPEPAGDGPDLVDGANALADLDSYRVSVESRGLVPATPPNGTVKMASTLVQGTDPAAEFTMTGVDGFAGGRLQAIVIGDEAWLKEGSAGWAKSPGGAADFDAAFTTLSPIDLATAFESLSPGLHKLASERRNGQPSVHYRATAADDATKLAGLTTGAADAWLAADDGHLVGMVIDGTWDVDGTPTAVFLDIEVSGINDRANTIASPR